MQEVSEARPDSSVADEVGRDTPERIIGILGMHRSGTSYLTGSLQQYGLFLGEHHTFSKHNRRGNRENQHIVDLHDSILAANGGAWDKPPKKAPWGPEHVARARELLYEYRAAGLFGFKDPRALIALDGWKALFPALEFVGIFRHPNAVAASLDKRQAKPWEECVELWYTYNRILYREYRKKKFPIINFDAEERVLDEKLSYVVGHLGLGEHNGEEKFFTDTLKNNTGEAGRPLPWKVRRLYRKLQKICI